MKRIYRPFVLSAAILLADQVSKQLIVMHIPQNTIGFEFFGGFLRIIHVANPAVAFSLGIGLPQPIRNILFIIIPIILLGILSIFSVKHKDVTQLQRWSFGAIVGGGAGNLIDRIFRTDGVIDFIDFKFYGIFGLERWPAFNVADSAIVVGSVLLIASVLFQREKRADEK